MENNDKTNDVFVSYSHFNKDIADAVVNRLENVGIKCWYASRDINLGEIWEEAIIRAIKASRVFVLILTKDSNSSKQVSNELTAAFNAECIIIPLRIEECKMSAKFEYYLNSVHWLDALTPPMEERIEELRDRIFKILSNSQIINKDANSTIQVEIKPQTDNVPQEILNEAKALSLSTKSMTGSDDILNVAQTLESLLDRYNSPEIALQYSWALANATSKITNVSDILVIDEKLKSLVDRYDMPKIAEQYSWALANTISTMTNVNDTLAIDEKLKSLLDRYNTLKIAEQYSWAITNAISIMTSASDILKAADNIKSLLNRYISPKIAEQYSLALVNATEKMSDIDSILEATDKLRQLLNSYNSPKISEQYLSALTNAISAMSNSGDILEAADKIKPILESCNSPKITLIFSCALGDATSKIRNSGDILKVADIIKSMLDSCNSLEIVEQYAIALVNASIVMTRSDDILEAADKLKQLLDSYNSQKIAVYYITINYRCIIKTKRFIRKQQIQNNVFEVIDRYGKDELIKAADTYTYGVEAIEAFTNAAQQLIINDDITNDVWGIKNLSNDTWNISLNGDSRIIKPDSAIPIVNGATITFNQIKGSIIKQ